MSTTLFNLSLLSFNPTQFPSVSVDNFSRLSHIYFPINFSWPHSHDFQINVGYQCNSSSSHHLTRLNNTQPSDFYSRLTTQYYGLTLDLITTSTSNNSNFVLGMYNQNFLSCFLSHFPTPTKSFLSWLRMPVSQLLSFFN